MVDEMLDVAQVARYLKTSEQTVRRMARRAVVPAFKVGRAWRFKKSSLDRWADHCSESGRSRPHRAKVLVVDDDELILSVMQVVLERHGLTPLTTTSGAEALALIEADPPDVVFLDLKMPGMDGPETLRQIRAKWRALPVVILTAYPDSELVSRALEYSPITMLSKPARADQILDAVQEAMRSRAPGIPAFGTSQGAATASGAW